MNLETSKKLAAWCMPTMKYEIMRVNSEERGAVIQKLEVCHCDHSYDGFKALIQAREYSRLDGRHIFILYTVKSVLMTDVAECYQGQVTFLD